MHQDNQFAAHALIYPHKNTKKTVEEIEQLVIHHGGFINHYDLGVSDKICLW
jgi:hypothetical protein